MADVRPLKDSGEGYEQDLDANQDHILVRGVKLQDDSGIDSLVKVGRDANGNMTLEDGHVDPILLSVLASAAPAAGYANVARTNGLVTGVSIYKEAGETTLIYQATVTYSGDDVSQVVEEQRDNAGVLVRTLTTSITRNGDGDVTDVNTVVS
jgi:hypothetical protein